jgi:hypothetical protein
MRSYILYSKFIVYFSMPLVDGCTIDDLYRGLWYVGIDIEALKEWNPTFQQLGEILGTFACMAQREHVGALDMSKETGFPEVNSQKRKP